MSHMSTSSKTILHDSSSTPVGGLKSETPGLKDEPNSEARYSVLIKYCNPGLQPPLYIAGTMTTPPWELCEMKTVRPLAAGSTFEFEKQFQDLLPGRYQYKFLVGSQSLWVLDDDVETGTADPKASESSRLLCCSH